MVEMIHFFHQPRSPWIKSSLLYFPSVFLRNSWLVLPASIDHFQVLTPAGLVSLVWFFEGTYVGTSVTEDLRIDKLLTYLWLMIFPNLELTNMSRGSLAWLSSPAREMWLKVICVVTITLGSSQTTSREVPVISRLAWARTMTGWDLSCQGIFIQVSHFSVQETRRKENELICNSVIRKF